MPFTKAYAKILAGMLEGDALRAFRVICGKDANASEISKDALDELIDLELVNSPTKNILDGKSVVTLTSRGKKVAEFV